jgi:hypothetical protein
MGKPQDIIIRERNEDAHLKPDALFSEEIIDIGDTNLCQSSVTRLYTKHFCAPNTGFLEQMNPFCGPLTNFSQRSESIMCSSTEIL